MAVALLILGALRVLLQLSTADENLRAASPDQEAFMDANGSLRKRLAHRHLPLVLLTSLLLCGLLAVPLVQAGSDSDFLKSVNEDNRRHYRNGLFLGMFNSQEDAERFIHEQRVNPITLEPYDVAFAFGMSGNQPWVKVWEAVRVVGDNLSWSPLTNYSRVQGMQFDYLVTYSNANDVAANAIKAGLVRATNLIALAPPAGFRNEARDLPGVRSVEIYRTKGDPVAEVLGKKTLLGFLQKFGDLNLGVIRKGDTPVVGMELRKPLPERIPATTVKERIFEGPHYFTDKPHQYETNANNVALSRMYALKRDMDTASPRVATQEKMNALKQKLGEYSSKFPEAASKLEVPSYWVSPDPTVPTKPRTEAQMLLDMARDKKKVIIVGKGPEADMMYQHMVNKLGLQSVKRLEADKDHKILQREARAFGADVILGVRESKIQVGAGVAGVEVDPKPSESSRGGAEVREKALKSRPSGGALSWPMEAPKGTKP